MSMYLLCSLFTSWTATVFSIILLIFSSSNASSQRNSSSNCVSLLIKLPAFIFNSPSFSSTMWLPSKDCGALPTTSLDKFLLLEWIQAAQRRLVKRARARRKPNAASLELEQARFERKHSCKDISGPSAFSHSLPPLLAFVTIFQCVVTSISFVPPMHWQGPFLRTVASISQSTETQIQILSCLNFFTWAWKDLVWFARLRLNPSSLLSVARLTSISGRAHNHLRPKNLSHSGLRLTGGLARTNSGAILHHAVNWKTECEGIWVNKEPTRAVLGTKNLSIFYSSFLPTQSILQITIFRCLSSFPPVVEEVASIDQLAKLLTFLPVLNTFNFHHT